MITFAIFELFRFVGVLFFSYISIIFLIGGIKTLFADKTEYMRLHKLSDGLINTLKGTVKTRKNSNHIPEVYSGIAYDVKNKKLIAQGGLSDNSINKIIR